MFLCLLMNDKAPFIPCCQYWCYWYPGGIIQDHRSYELFLHEHDDVIKWKQFPRYWPFVRGIHRSPVNSPHKGQWRGALMFSLICVWINGWVNNREAGDLRRYRVHYDVTVMIFQLQFWKVKSSPCFSPSAWLSYVSAIWHHTIYGSGYEFLM